MIDKSIVKQITNIVGKENVVEDKETRICYSYDATNRRYLPDLIVFPSTPGSKSPTFSNWPTNPVFR